MNGIATKVVLIEKINNSFPYSKCDIVIKNWNKGTHPDTCIGACKIECTFIVNSCSNCGWVDSY